MNAHDFKATSIDGAPVDFASFKGKTLLVVNVASQCGLTPQYTGLEALWRKHKDAGLVVIGFPCDQFGNQEPGTEAEIKTFCETRYSVTFPMMAKVEVNGDNAHPLWKWMRAQQPGSEGGPATDGAITWNFAKFVIDPTGAVVKRVPPSVKPESFESDLVSLLPR